MVVRRDTNKEQNKKSDIEKSSDSDEEDLEYLIDGLLGNFSLDQPKSQDMTIKKRKEPSKHDRPDRTSDIESSTTVQGETNVFGVRRGQQGRMQYVSVNRKAKARGHSAAVGIPLAQFAAGQDGARSRSTVNRMWSASRENQICRQNRLKDCQDNMNDLSTGNNSEDEYGQVADNRPTGNVDHGLDQLLKEKKGWKVVRVHGDGACLFRSVAHQVFGDEEKHDVIRKQVVDYMTKNREHFSQYVTEDFDRYLRRKSQPSCFGNHLEIQAIAEIYNRPIEIYYKSVNPINVFHSEYEGLVPFRLAYYDTPHYNSVIDPCKPSFGHGLGMPNYQPELPEKDLVKQAILESEATEIEETMLRDKLAESETKQLEDCIAEHVLRESLLEHIKPTDRQRLSLSPKSRRSPPSPTAVLTWRTEPTTRTSTSQMACSSASSSTVLPSSSKLSAPVQPSSASSSSKSPTGGAAETSAALSNSASIDPSAVDFTVLQYIPANMLDMSEEEVLAMVMEQSRCEYVESLRSAASAGANRDQDDDFEGRVNAPSVASYLENPDSSESHPALSSSKADDLSGGNDGGDIS
ncbi:hypothetical protein Aperf_G00000100343 [Anoplocephala perfoliata]